MVNNGGYKRHKRIIVAVIIHPQVGTSSSVAKWMDLWFTFYWTDCRCCSRRKSCKVNWKTKTRTLPTIFFCSQTGCVNSTIDFTVYGSQVDTVVREGFQIINFNCSRTCHKLVDPWSMIWVTRSFLLQLVFDFIAVWIISTPRVIWWFPW